MAQTDRHYKIRQCLSSGRCVTRDFLLRELEISPATLKRDLALLRDRLNVPLSYDHQQRGWRLTSGHQAQGTQVELPGLWLSAEEIHALLTMQHLLSNLDAGGLLAPHIQPLQSRLNQLLASAAPPNADVARRIRVQTVGARTIHLPHFQAVGAALLRRSRLLIQYRARSVADQAQPPTFQPHAPPSPAAVSRPVSEREVSPQRLVHYRDNWYLDAWCHLRGALRSFSVDAIGQVQVLNRAAIDVSEAELDDTLGAGYGIFAGKQVAWARLRFTAERARWVASERWHKLQRGWYDHDGSWLLDLPYADPRELVMDILRHMPDVQVMWPDELANEVRKRLQLGLQRMGPG